MLFHTRDVPYLPCSAQSGFLIEPQRGIGGIDVGSAEFSNSDGMMQKNENVIFGELIQLLSTKL